MQWCKCLRGATDAKSCGAERAIGWGEARIDGDCRLVLADRGLNIPTRRSLDLALDEMCHGVIRNHRQHLAHGIVGTPQLICRRLAPTIVDLDGQSICQADQRLRKPGVDLKRAFEEGA